MGNQIPISPCCSGVAGCSDPRQDDDPSNDKLKFDSKEYISEGGDKYIFLGKYGKQKVAVVIAKRRHEKRLQNEIAIFEQIGLHPNIVQMLFVGEKSGLPLAAIEAVEPIGYDISSLANQYSWTGYPVPGSLMKSLIRQLIDALDHMHSRKLIHQDLKMANVLVTSNQEVKLIDFGIVTQFGERGRLKAPYLAPEVCKAQYLTEKVDCWGVGLILHQVYQKTGVLLRMSPEVTFAKGVPSSVHPMPEKVNMAMRGLLAEHLERRWSLRDLRQSVWFEEQSFWDNADAEEPVSFSVTKPLLSLANSPNLHADCRKYLQKFTSSKLPVTAYAAAIHASQGHIIGKKLEELDLGNSFNATVLLVCNKDGTYETLPDDDTEMTADSWVYFGIKQDTTEDADDAADKLQAALCKICETLYGRSYDPKARTAGDQETGDLLPFTLNFDCFAFPGDPESERRYVLGVAESAAELGLDMRKTMHLNIAGIVRNDEEHTEEWFPGADATVGAGDLLLLVRCPRQDGMSDPTVTDSDLQPLLDFLSTGKQGSRSDEGN